MDNVRIWDYYNRTKYIQLDETIEQEEKGLEDCRIYENNDILLEMQIPRRGVLYNSTKIRSEV